MKRLAAPTKKSVRVAPVRPNLGLEVAYQRSLDRMLDRMHAAIAQAVAICWRRKPPELAADESPAAALQAMMGRLTRKWKASFDEFARTRGRAFGGEAAAQADRSFAAQLRKAGFTVRFQPTRAWNDVKQATIQANVGLIRSIPAEHLTAVEGIVMRGVQNGRDMHSISEALQHQFGVTKRRAAFIARDQANKATAAITRVRQAELGITEAEWLHSGGGRHPRPEHVAFSGKRYAIDKGAYLEGKWVWPGTEPNCRCVCKSIIPGIS
jgi:SPP1 gp7 family putative phage head morphogenesis protein